MDKNGRIINVITTEQFEELRTVGIFGFSENDITENDIRNEHKEKLRAVYKIDLSVNYYNSLSDKFDLYKGFNYVYKKQSSVDSTWR